MESTPDVWHKSGKRGVTKTLINDWMALSDGAGNEVAWLPLNPKLRDSETFEIKKLKMWFDSIEGSEYSFAKEFFAAVDHPHHAFPLPLNS